MSSTIAANGIINSVTAENAKSRWEDLIDRVRRGEEWLITSPDGRLVAKLTPATTNPGTTVDPWEQESKSVQWPDFMARLRDQWPDGTPGQALSEIVDEGRGTRP